METMFNPSTGIEACEAAWKRHACRKIYFDMMGYLNRIHEIRTNLDSDVTVVVPATAYKSDLFTQKSLIMGFCSFFVRNSYIRDDGGAYPNPAYGQQFQYQCQPVVFVTRRRGPRHGKCRFLRPVHLDANVLTNEINHRNGRLGIAMNGGFDFATGFGVIDCVVHRPEHYAELAHRYDIDRRLSFAQCFVKEKPEKMNLMAIIFIRGYIKYLCDISCAGRDFLSPMGNIQPMFDVLGAHVIVGNYTIRDLYYKYCSDYYGSVKNYGKMFEINFFNEIKDWTNVTYFGAWFSCLTSKGTKKKVI
jgi:hypothetical protein